MNLPRRLVPHPPHWYTGTPAGSWRTLRHLGHLTWRTPPLALVSEIAMSRQGRRASLAVQSYRVIVSRRRRSINQIRCLRLKISRFPLGVHSRVRDEMRRPPLRAFAAPSSSSPLSLVVGIELSRRSSKSSPWKQAIYRWSSRVNCLSGLRTGQPDAAPLLVVRVMEARRQRDASQIGRAHV